jgi:hypothetical protein
MLARLGQQSGFVTKPFSKLTPRPANSLCTVDMWASVSGVGRR